MSDLHVIFGTGPAGRAVMRELLRDGRRVRLVNRSGAGAFPEGVELMPGDAADRRFTRDACREATVVYQCLAPPYHRWPELFPRLQAGIIEGAMKAEARLVALENVYMYGSPYGKPLTERTPMTATTRKGRLRAELAEQLLEAHKKGRVRVTLGRASDFFGPEVRRSAMGSQVFQPALEGRAASIVGDPQLPHTYSYLPDVARGLVTLAQRDEALGEVWHLPGPETVTTREFLTMVFAEAGHRTKLRRAGSATLRAIGFFKPEVREMVEMLYQFEEPFVVDHGKFAAAFGDAHVTPLQEAIRETVAWYRAETSSPEPDESAADDEESAEELAREAETGDAPLEEAPDQKSTE